MAKKKPKRIEKRTKVRSQDPLCLNCNSKIRFVEPIQGCCCMACKVSYESRK